MLGFFRRQRFTPTPIPQELSAEQQQQLELLLAKVGLRILRQSRGPMPLLKFGRMVQEHLEFTPPVPLPYFSAALKQLIQKMDDERLRVLSPSEFLGVGYVYNAHDPETWPVRSHW